MVERVVKKYEKMGEYESPVAETTGERVLRRIGKVGFVAAGALAGAGIALQTQPYETQVAGINARVSVAAPAGIHIATSVGGIEFASPASIPLGLRVEPAVNLETLQAAASDMTTFSEHAQAEFAPEAEKALRHFGIVGLTGIGAGALGAVLMLEGISRSRKGRHYPLAVSAAGALTALGVIAGVGAATYDQNWQEKYRVTGLLADIQAVPQQLEDLNQLDITNGKKQILAMAQLRDALLSPLGEKEAPDTAFSVLLVSDMHLRNMYPQLRQYIEEYDVKLVINSGDEALFGVGKELTDSYKASIADMTKEVPMVWVEGNHDSRETAAAMDEIPGVIVLNKETVGAYGLSVGGLGDPRQYSSGGDIGADAVEKVERGYARVEAEELQASGGAFDIFVTHDPNAADETARVLGSEAVRMTIAGHQHQQDLSQDGVINIVEGTTGMNGLGALGVNRAPMSFSILRVAPDCQFTSLVRFQVSDPTLPNWGNASPYGSDSIVQNVYLTPQDIGEDRACSTSLGVSEAMNWHDQEY